MAKRRIAALALAVIVLLFCALTAVLGVSHAHHGCDHEDCEVCAFIAICTRLLREAAAAACIIALFGAVIAEARDYICGDWHFFAMTPVKLNIKLSI
ncbi:MAG: hypothetical protein IJ788_04455 [Oscillospiraceae bacterium]|nr:hypothetical protein [Oscillospiraceae bacterium]